MNPGYPKKWGGLFSPPHTYSPATTSLNSPSEAVNMVLYAPDDSQPGVQLNNPVALMKRALGGGKRQRRPVHILRRDAEGQQCALRHALVANVRQHRRIVDRQDGHTHRDGRRPSAMVFAVLLTVMVVAACAGGTGISHRLSVRVVLNNKRKHQLRMYVCLFISLPPHSIRQTSGSSCV